MIAFECIDFMSWDFIYWAHLNFTRLSVLHMCGMVSWLEIQEFKGN